LYWRGVHVTKVLLHAGERGSRIEEPLLHAGFSVVGIPTKPTQRNKILKFFSLMKVILKEDPDCIIVDSAGLMCVSAYFLSRIFRIPHILRVRADIWAIHEEQKEYYNGVRRMYELVLLKLCEAVFKRATKLFPISEYLKGIMKKKGIKEEIVRVMRISIDGERFHPSKDEDKLIRLLSVSNLSFKRKTEGIVDVIPVIDEVISKYENVEYKIAGKGMFSQMLEETLKNIKNKDKISYIGYKKDIEKLFSHADIFVHYSHLDAYPAAVLEAMASSTPVIATKFGGMVEQVEEGVTGFLVDDLSSFKDALEMLIRDKKMREEMGKKGRLYVLRTCNIAVVGESYKKAIDELLR